MTANIIRAPKGEDRPYVATRRATAQDSALSFEARGLLWYLLSKPDNWKVNRADLQKVGGIGRDKVKRIIEELQAANYLKMERQNDEKGFLVWHYRVYEVPYTENPHTVNSVGDPSTEKPATVKPCTENKPTYIKENIDNTESHKELSPDGDSEAEKPKEPRKRSEAQQRLDRMVDALVVVFGLDPDKITRSKWSEFRAAGKQLLDVNATPDVIPGLHAWCKRKGWTDFTSMAMAKSFADYEKQHRAKAPAAPADDHGMRAVMSEALAANDG